MTVFPYLGLVQYLGFSSACSLAGNLKKAIVARVPYVSLFALTNRLICVFVKQLMALELQIRFRMAVVVRAA